VLLARFALRAFARFLMACSTLAHSSGTARGNALKNKQPRTQQILANSNSSARNNPLKHKRPRAQQKPLHTAAAAQEATR
jgi:hypothetical protein